MTIKTTKIAAGAYRVEDTDYVAPSAHHADQRYVNVTFNEYEYGNGWVAAASWDTYNVTDPLWTKREAVAAAHRMLEE